MIGWCGSEFSILRDRLFEASLALLASLFSLYENRKFVDRGLGGAEYVILRGGFSREEGNSISFAQISLLLVVKIAEFVFDKTVSLNLCSQNPHRLNMCLLQSISRDSHPPLGAHLGRNGAWRSEFLVGGDVGHEMICAMGVVHAQGAGEDVAHNSNANFL